MASSNPTLNEKFLDRYTTEYDGYGQNGYGQPATPVAEQRVMTVEGTINKALVLFAILLASAAFTWSAIFSGNAGTWILPLAIGGAFGALIIGFVTTYRPKTAPITAPIYAALEGLAVGAVSAILNARYHGIVMQAVMITLGVMGIMLMIYRTGLIRVTPRLQAGIYAAGLAVFLVYGVNLLMRAFGNASLSNFLWEPSLVSIGVSLAFSAVAAFYLLLDFDFIEKGAERRAPLFVEWYAAFGLMVTIVWLYMEVLRLLSKLNRR